MSWHLVQNQAPSALMGTTGTTEWLPYLGHTCLSGVLSPCPTRIAVEFAKAFDLVKDAARGGASEGLI